MNLLDDLSYRGMIYQCTDKESMKDFLLSNKIKVYLGFDPTAESLHIGSLVGILLLRRFQLAGHHPIPLVGGATGLIGDPKPTLERALNSLEVVENYSQKVKRQLQNFLDFDAIENSAVIVNNYDWTRSVDVITFLREIGKYFNVNYMLSKEVVSSRLEKGISYTEFSYMVLQAFDYLNLYRNYNCRLQIGGSDQWGNITAGHELIRKLEPGAKVFAFTFPLVTKSDGTKFGKTESGTIWLDRNLTSPYEFYQFWYNTDDRDIIKYMKYYSFLPKDDIEQYAVLVKNEPEKRAAQKYLAQEMTELVHGSAAFKEALRISEALFTGNVRSLTCAEVKQTQNSMPSFWAGDEDRLLELLVLAKICSSKRQAREDIKQGAIYVNDEKCTAENRKISSTDKIGGEFVFIRRGKKKYFLLQF